jgi:hypothetical protein
MHITPEYVPTWMGKVMRSYSPTANAGLPVNPAKSLHTKKLPKLLESPAPRVNSMNIGADTRYTGLRPNLSDNGAEMTGPKARPSVYKVSPRIATVREILKCDVIETIAGV